MVHTLLLTFDPRLAASAAIFIFILTHLAGLASCEGGFHDSE